MKVNDIHQWSYSETFIKSLRQEDQTSRQLYWCKSQLARFDGKFLVDLFWSTTPTRFTMEDVKERLNLKFLGNLDDYERVNYPNDLRARYKPEDILDLTHGNSARNQIYLKKDAQLDKETILKSLNHDQAELEGAEESLKWKKECLVKVRKSVEEGKLEEYYRVI